METLQKEDRRISFHFHPYRIEAKEHAVEKSEGGRKRRYLRGISSGVKIDGHGERMTQKCIDSFSQQANSGDILLYPDLHGVRFTDDIGILTNHKVMPEGDWYTEFRLYDEGDSAEQYQIERANALWKQVNGMPPYTKPRQKGFSIEGHIPDNGIQSVAPAGQRVIDNVELDGVVVVPRPAYKDSIASAVYKALGEPAPWVATVEKSVVGRLQEIMRNEELENTYYKRKFQIHDALEEEVKLVMQTAPEIERGPKIKQLYEEFGSLMTELVLSCPEKFAGDVGLPMINAVGQDTTAVLKSMLKTLDQIKKAKANKR